jgi:mevalonate kinase
MSFFGLGKIILLGEHSVVYGFPALAAALDRGVRVGAVPTPAGGTLRVDLPAWNVKLTAADDHQLATALAAIADALELGRPPVTLVGEAQIPPGAGLGASAAFAVAIARALLDYRARQTAPKGAEVPPPSAADVIAAANASEAIVHGRASGVDVALATHGGVGVFRKASGLRPMQIPALRVLVGPGGAPRSTAAMVERVAEATSASDDDTRLRELGGLTDVGTSALLAKDLGGLGRSMDRAHDLLGELGVTTPLLDALCAAARKVGAYGAKLTGAGGGGAVIAIAPRDKEAAVLAAWRAAKVEGFVATIGGR